MTLRDLPLADEPVLPQAQLENCYSTRTLFSCASLHGGAANFLKRCGAKDEKAVLLRRPLYHLI
jgi:hypothetical protein